MNINRKYIIIFGVSTLLILIIFGFKAYYQERKSQEPISIEEGVYYTEVVLDQNYPLSFDEANSFYKSCVYAVTFGDLSINTELEKGQQIKENLCILARVEQDTKSVDKYTTIFTLFNKVLNLQQDQYIGIAVNYSDLLKKNAFSLSEESSFNLCAVTKPALIEPFREQLLLEDQINLNRSIVFPEGEIFCSKFSGLPSQILNFLITGFVPEVDLFRAKMYLVLEDETVDDIFSQESFSDIEEILKSYPLLWNVEKPVINIYKI